MSALLIYAAGFATPFVLAILVVLFCDFMDWHAGRRYSRAWLKFSLEWKAMSEEEKSMWKKYWEQHSYAYGHLHSDLDRYFTMRWQYGRTKEV